MGIPIKVRHNLFITKLPNECYYRHLWCILGLLNNYLTEGGNEGEAPLDGGSQEEEESPIESEADSMLHSCIVSMLSTLATNFPQYGHIFI